MTGRSWFVSMEYRFTELAQYLRGWMNYFGISESYLPIPEIVQWLRRRVRMCYWKQWRYARTKVRELLKLGTYRKTAIFVAISRKGPWHLARTLATQTGMSKIPFQRGWCGEGELKAPLYPIRCRSFQSSSLWTHYSYCREVSPISTLIPSDQIHTKYSGLCSDIEIWQG